MDSKKAPFFKHGEAHFWIAWRDGEAVGRISAQIDYAQPAEAFGNAGLFGCLDAIDDIEVTRALLEAAESWLHDKGHDRALGPFLLTINEEPGLLVDGHDEPPLTMVPWHPPYLEQHLVTLGYLGCRDMHYWRISDFSNSGEAFKTRKRLPPLPADVTIRRLDMKNFARDVEIMRKVYNDAWKDNWGFVPLQPEDMEGISTDLKPFVRSEAGMIVEDAGKPIAVAMIIPNLFEITSDIGADPSLIGWAKLGSRTYFHKFHTGRIILFGMRSELRHSVRGAVIALAMVDDVITRVHDYKHHNGWLEAGWVLDNNEPLQKILTQLGFQKTRTLRLYEKTL
ncbi:MAG: hypothetical protein K8F25_15530 [Fimbriimonadaceae bacterium]|nr:hypothetical protein [Alphaproteobacteria bacterium]